MRKGILKMFRLGQKGNVSNEIFSKFIIISKISEYSKKLQLYIIYTLYYIKFIFNSIIILNAYRILQDVSYFSRYVKMKHK